MVTPDSAATGGLGCSGAKWAELGQLERLVGWRVTHDPGDTQPSLGPYLERGFTGRLDAQSSREAGGGIYLLQFGRPGGHLRAGTPKQIPPEELAYGGRIWNWLTNGQSNLRGVGREPLPRGLPQPSSMPQIKKLRHRPLLAHMPCLTLESPCTNGPWTNVICLPVSPPSSWGPGGGGQLSLLPDLPRLPGMGK